MKKIAVTQKNVEDGHVIAADCPVTQSLLFVSLPVDEKAVMDRLDRDVAEFDREFDDTSDYDDTHWG